LTFSFKSFGFHQRWQPKVATKGGNQRWLPHIFQIIPKILFS